MENFFIGFVIITLLSNIFNYIGELKWGLFSSIFDLFGTVLKIPLSLEDLLIMGYKLEFIIMVIGTLIIVHKIYKFFN